MRRRYHFASGFVPTPIMDGAYVVFVEIKDHSVIYVSGNSHKKLDHSIDFLEHILKDKARILAAFDRIDPEKAKPILDRIVKEAIEYSQRRYKPGRFDFEGRLRDYGRNPQLTQP